VDGLLLFIKGKKKVRRKGGDRKSYFLFDRRGQKKKDPADFPLGGGRRGALSHLRERDPKEEEGESREEKKGGWRRLEQGQGGIAGTSSSSGEKKEAFFSRSKKKRGGSKGKGEH